MTGSIISRYAKQVFENILKYKYTILTTIILYFTSLYQIRFHNLATLMGVASFLFLLNALAKTKYTFIFTFILAFFLSFDIYFLITYSGPFSSGIMSSIMETSPSEITSMGKTILPVGLTILAFILFILLMAEKELKESFLSRNKSLIIWGVFLIFMTGHLYKKIKENPRASVDLSISPFEIAADYAYDRYPLIYRSFMIFLSYHAESIKIKQYAMTERQLPANISFNDQTQSPQTIFLVIGESACRDLFSLYGYDIKTNPFLDTLKNNPSANLKYYNAIAAAPITRDAIRLMLSFATPLDFTSFFKEKNVIELANDAGYETYWISSQARVGINESYITQIASNAADTYFDNEIDKDDLDLIPLVKEKLNTDKKQMFILHLNGSHTTYKDRHDKIDEEAIEEKSDYVDYERTLHHTDRFLKGIYDQFNSSSRSAVLYYVSDHGETMGVGHGALIGQKSQFNIPLATISKDFTRTDSIISRYVDKETSLINNSSTSGIIAELLGYHVDNEYVNKALLTGQYIYHVDAKVYLYSQIPD